MQSGINEWPGNSLNHIVGARQHAASAEETCAVSHFPEGYPFANSFASDFRPLLLRRHNVQDRFSLSFILQWERRRMARWLACTVLAAFILGDPARAGEATGRDRFWLDAEVLGWKIGDAPQPTPLVTAGSLTAPLPGALGQPGTSVVIGGSSVSLPIQIGGRFALGTWVERAAGLGSR
jgi:hypothetical protein